MKNSLLIVDMQEGFMEDKKQKDLDSKVAVQLKILADFRRSETPHSKLLPTGKSVYGRSGASESKKHYYLLQPLILIEHKIITFVKIFYFSYCNPALLYPHSKLWGIKEE